MSTNAVELAIRTPDLTEDQRCILISIFEKVAQTALGQSVKWHGSEEIPTIPLSVIARALRELEVKKLIVRLPKKQVKLTGLGVQTATFLLMQSNGGSSVDNFQGRH